MDRSQGIAGINKSPTPSLAMLESSRAQVPPSSVLRERDVNTLMRVTPGSAGSLAIRQCAVRSLQASSSSFESFQEPLTFQSSSLSVDNGPGAARIDASPVPVQPQIAVGRARLGRLFERRKLDAFLSTHGLSLSSIGSSFLHAYPVADQQSCAGSGRPEAWSTDGLLPDQRNPGASAAPGGHEESSDDDLAERENENLYFFTPNTPPVAGDMTVSSREKNIKGSTLVQMVHNVVKSYRLAQQSPCSAHFQADEVLHIRKPMDWFTSLGGWSKWAPKSEVQGGQRFSGVSIYGNPHTFRIDPQSRIHLPEGFSIFGLDMCRRQGKTDLSYRQIAEIIRFISTKLELTDPDIATLQLYALNRSTPPLWFNEENHADVLYFLDYLNSLIFGVEASGLNTGLVTGLMTLELIVGGIITYRQAFCENENGGFYPFASVGSKSGSYSSNAGSYRARTAIVGHKAYGRDCQLSMKDYREGDPACPVAVKEAILIRKWLHFRGVVSSDTKFSQQIKNIKSSTRELIVNYYFPTQVSPVDG